MFEYVGKINIVNHIEQMKHIVNHIEQMKRNGSFWDVHFAGLLG